MTTNERGEAAVQVMMAPDSAFVLDFSSSSLDSGGLD
jgi:hypothetical protein